MRKIYGEVQVFNATLISMDRRDRWHNSRIFYRFECHRLKRVLRGEGDIARDQRDRCSLEWVGLRIFYDSVLRASQFPYVIARLTLDGWEIACGNWCRSGTVRFFYWWHIIGELGLQYQPNVSMLEHYLKGVSGRYSMSSGKDRGRGCRGSLCYSMDLIDHQQYPPWFHHRSILKSSNHGRKMFRYWDLKYRIGCLWGTSGLNK